VEQWLRTAMEATADPGSSAATEAQIRCLCRGAIYLQISGRHDAQLAALQMIDTLSSAAQDCSPLLAGWMYQARGMYCYHLGQDAEAAIEAFDQAWRSFRAAGDSQNAIVNRFTVAMVWADLGAYQRALEILREAQGEAERSRVQLALHKIHQVLGFTLLLGGQLAEGRDLLLRVLEIARERRPLVCGTHVWLSWYFLLVADLDSAEAHAHAAIENAEGPPERAPALAALSRTLAARGHLEQALLHGRQAQALLAAARIITPWCMEALLRLSWSEVLLAAGDLAAAAHAAAEQNNARILMLAAYDPRRPHANEA
jgi:tetratricopeptide (TPR) repeat protein